MTEQQYVQRLGREIAEVTRLAFWISYVSKIKPVDAGPWMYPKGYSGDDAVRGRFEDLKEAE